MKYSTDQAMNEILRRGNRIADCRDRRACRILSAASVVLLAAAVTVIARLSGQTGAEADQSVYGAFLLPSDAGGYVLAGVLAFALGVTVTILCLRMRKWKDRRKETRDDAEDVT